MDVLYLRRTAERNSENTALVEAQCLSLDGNLYNVMAWPTPTLNLVKVIKSVKIITGN